jgi:mannose-1-phosphate guanylyltransferase
MSSRVQSFGITATAPGAPDAALWGVVLSRPERPRLPDPAWTPCPDTLERAASLVAPMRLVVVVEREAPRRLPEGVVQVTQPRYRGSAVSTFLSLLTIARHDPDASVVVWPPRLGVEHGARFLRQVVKAVDAVRQRPDLTLLIGMQPETRRSGQVWLEPGPAVRGFGSLDVRTVSRVVFAPSPSERARLFDTQGLVSTSVIVARLRTLMRLGRRRLPDVLEALEPVASAAGSAEELLLREAVYEAMPYASLSRTLLARPGDFSVLAVPDLSIREAEPALAEPLAS